MRVEEWGMSEPGREVLRSKMEGVWGMCKVARVWMLEALAWTILASMWTTVGQEFWYTWPKP